MRNKCKFHKRCTLYDKDSITCNKNAGMYYGDLERPAGCYIRMEEKESEKN